MRTIVLYGNSLAVSTIGASLQACADLELVRLDAPLADMVKRLVALELSAVVFDRSLARPDFAIALLDDHPKVLLIGVEPSSDKVLVLSGRQEQPLSVADLVRLIMPPQPDEGGPR